ncbi:MAG: response regulator [Candidatus Sulfotelmatobacter sp.]
MADIQVGLSPATHADRATLLQSQKTELVGQLAGAMANQFNNIMMAITSYAELELKKATPDQKRNLEQVLSNTARATSLIQKLLAFTRKQSPTPCSLSLNAVVEDISRLLQPLVGEDIGVSVKLDPSVGSIVADPTEIEQLVLTLGMNARDALNLGGTLEVSTELLCLEPTPGTNEESEPSGQHAMLCVRYAPPSGTAKAESAIAGNQDLRMTQAIAAVRTIARERRGHLRVSTRPGQGTTFRVYFPASTAELAEPAKEVSIVNAASSTKTVLIVEDDDAVRNPAAEFLKMEGFKVLQARTGPEALRIVQESRSRLDLLITDIVMAGMHGTKVAEELHKTHPALKVLFMSGDVHVAAKATKGSRVDNLLQKPFRLNKLNDKIRELLGE